MQKHNLNERFPGVEVRIPRIVAIGTDEFDSFLSNNDLLDFALKTSDRETLNKRFLAANLSEKLMRFLKKYLQGIKTPIVVRTAGRYAIPFACGDIRDLHAGEYVRLAVHPAGKPVQCH